jgi:hypothetical protein
MVWTCRLKGQVIETDLIGPQLHRQRAFPLAEPLVELQHLLVDIGVCLYVALPLLSLPYAQRRSEWV